MLTQATFRSSSHSPSTELDSSPLTLTCKEKVVLRWGALGKSSWEIARIIGCTEAGVNFHFCNIRRKFGVSSRHIAILIALERGLIELG